MSEDHHASDIHIDGFIPPEMAKRAESVGVSKANLGLQKMFLLAILAGAFISLGAVFATTVSIGLNPFGFGIKKLLMGFVFSLGLILVVVAGGELFTGNNLIVMAWANKKISSLKLIKNWTIVYIGNFVGALLTAVLLILSKQYEFADGQMGQAILNIASAKLKYGFIQAISLGILCNALVCLAVWLCFSARTTTDKILSILFPITAFVACGFEHCVANMYFVPVALFLKWDASLSFWQSIGSQASEYSSLNWPAFLSSNLVPVTIGNIIGGSLLVGIIYWVIYIREK